MMLRIIKEIANSTPNTMSMSEASSSSNCGRKKARRLREFGMYMMPGPNRVRTASKSFVQREARSPV